MGIKKPKGAVSVYEYKGRLKLRWRHAGKRYTIHFSFASELTLVAAKKLAVEIEQDIILGQFDQTLMKYTGKRKQDFVKPKSFVELFEYWVKNFKQMDCELHTNYNSTRNMIRKWGKVDGTMLVKKLNAEQNAPVTYNRRLTILRTFLDWLVEEKHWTNNPLTTVKRRKIKPVKLPKREPFTAEEISQILEAFRTNRFCSKYSNTKHHVYFPFLYFLFKTGVRNAEAIGLRVEHLDFINKHIHIREVLARTLKSAASKNRIRKATKNEKERILPLTPDLEATIKPLTDGKKQESLVFLSPTGKAINDENFRKSVFYPVLDKLGIRRRVLYACRHTFGSRCIDQGISPVMVAFLLGNNPETALRRYTHQLNIPDFLPSV